MPNYEILRSIERNKKPYKAGDIVSKEALEIDDAELNTLISRGVLAETEEAVLQEPSNPDKKDIEDQPPSNLLTQPNPTANTTLKDLINLNTATEEEIASVKYLGKAAAKAIASSRPYAEVNAAKPKNLNEEQWAEISTLFVV